MGEKFDSAQLNKNFNLYFVRTIFTVEVNIHGNEDKFKKTSSREGDNSGKKRKVKARRRTNLPIPSTEAVFINWNRKQLEVNEEIPTGQIAHWKIFHQNLHVPS